MNTDTRAFVAAGFAALIFGLGILAGDEIAFNRVAAREQTAINNAVSEALLLAESPLNCKDNLIIESIKAMAMNGGHVKHYDLWLELTNEPSGL